MKLVVPQGGDRECLAQIGIALEASLFLCPSIPTIKRLEAQDGPLGGRDNTSIKIRSALETAGVEFIDENGGRPGVRLRKRLGAGQCIPGSRSCQIRLRASVTTPSWTMRFPERSSGSTSPRFSRHSRTKKGDLIIARLSE